MRKRTSFSGEHLSLASIVEHREDVIESLKLYFSVNNPTYSVNFASFSQIELTELREGRKRESDLQAIFSLLSAIEAAFRIDYLARGQLKLKDALSLHFRPIYRRKSNAKLIDDIFLGWRLNANGVNRTINDLTLAFKYRNWLAHGRYWVRKIGPQYDFLTIQGLATQVFSSFPFEGM